jgi:hypothetical protein
MARTAEATQTAISRDSIMTPEDKLASPEFPECRSRRIWHGWRVNGFGLVVISSSQAHHYHLASLVVSFTRYLHQTK